MSLTRRAVLQALAGGAGLAALAPFRSSHAAAGTVVIAGGGFAGSACARYLRRLAPGLRIVLIDRHAKFVTGPFCNTVIAGLREMEAITQDHRALAAEGIEFVQAEISAVDPVARTVETVDGRRWQADKLVVTPGIGFRWDSIDGYNPAAAEVLPHAWPGGPEQIATLRAQLLAMPEGGLVAIAAPPNPYRCPPGPYERASLIAYFLERHKPRAKLLILDSKDDFSKEPLFRAGWAALYGDRIEWVGRADGGRVAAVDVSGHAFITAAGERVAADVLNPIPAQTAGRLAHIADLTDASGWAPVDHRDYQSLRHPNVHVMGDACDAHPMPKSAFAATSQAKCCAFALAAYFAGAEYDGSKIINACYSLVAPDYGISVTGVYAHNGADIAFIPEAGGTSPLAAPPAFRAAEADQARAWYANITRDAFGVAG